MCLVLVWEQYFCKMSMERVTFLSHELLDHEMRYSMVDKEFGHW